MKQRISVEDLSQLTDEQKEKLRAWWKQQEGDWVYNGEDETLLHVDADTDWIMFGSYQQVSKAETFAEAELEIKTKCLPLLSIGQMIEILREKDWNKLVILDHSGAIQDENLCDQLWQAVKAIL